MCATRTIHDIGALVTLHFDQVEELPGNGAPDVRIGVSAGASPEMAAKCIV
jgi:hypothetical protein